MLKFRIIRNWLGSAILVACLVHVAITLANCYQYGVYRNGVVKLKKAGVLKKVLEKNNLNITSLKVVGPINGGDVHRLRQMLGATCFKEAEWGKLTSLDLSEASIVAGGYPYYASGLCFNTSNATIGCRMFFNCDKLQHIVLPKETTSIDWNAFWGCSSLTSIEIPDGVTWIDSYAFYNCSSLVSIHIPDGVTSIEEGTFKGCSSLANVYCYAFTPPVLVWETFPEYGDKATLHVPKGRVSAYKKSDWRLYFNNIVEMK